MKDDREVEMKSYRVNGLTVEVKDEGGVIRDLNADGEPCCNRWELRIFIGELCEQGAFSTRVRDELQAQAADLDPYPWIEDDPEQDATDPEERGRFAIQRHNPDQGGWYTVAGGVTGEFGTFNAYSPIRVRVLSGGKWITLVEITL